MKANVLHEIQVFRPSVLKKNFAPNTPLIRSEGRLLSDLTMPLRDWTKYDAPTWERMGKPHPWRDRSVPEFLKVAP
jgi:hypothetical protein